MKCYCGRPCYIRTSWTNNNPGRRFLGCEKYGNYGGCGFFTWYDPPMCVRSTILIPGLLRKLKKQETKIAALQKKKRALWTVILISWFLALFLFFW